LGYAHGVVRSLFILQLAVAATLSISGFALAREIELVSSKDQNLETAGAPYAPLEVSRPLEVSPSLPLTRDHRAELLSEFKGLVHMGLRKVSYEKWEGKDMADCTKPENAEERWSYRCQIITGEGNGFYYFYPGESRRTATLQELDIRMDAADEKVLDDFRRPVQDLFGKGSIVEKPSVRAQPRGPIRHWNTGNDVVELFIDHSVRPEGSVRFVWMRSPLVGGASASLPHRSLNSEPLQ
jgi:hypothetical protein